MDVNYDDPKDANEFFAAEEIGDQYVSDVIEAEQDRELGVSVSPIQHILKDSPDTLAYLADFEGDFAGFLHAAFMAGWFLAKGTKICEECGWVGTTETCPGCNSPAEAVIK